MDLFISYIPNLINWKAYKVGKERVYGVCFVNGIFNLDSCVF